MRERLFRFKRFAVSHERAAMKVGTDGVTLGAIAPVGRRVLDVGCGCGLIGLMMAQRGAEEVVLLDIDPDAAAEAADNAAASPWSDKVTARCGDFLSYASAERFDTIVCNPPFFALGLQAPDLRRALARHEDSLPPQRFMAHAAELLNAGGCVSVIIPPDRLADWNFAAELAGLKCTELCRLLTKPGAEPRRVIARYRFRSEGAECRGWELPINSEEYKKLTSPFYL